jgi:hypothetical protein
VGNDAEYYVVLKLSLDLPLEIYEDSGIILPTLVDERLAHILDLAIDNAAYEGNWQGLVRLRECLLHWAEEAQSALKQIADAGPYRDRGKFA